MSYNEGHTVMNSNNCSKSLIQGTVKLTNRKKKGVIFKYKKKMLYNEGHTVMNSNNHAYCSKSLNTRPSQIKNTCFSSGFLKKKKEDEEGSYIFIQVKTKYVV